MCEPLNGKQDEFSGLVVIETDDLLGGGIGDGYLAAANLVDSSLSGSRKYDVTILASHESQKESSDISTRAREWAIASDVHITSWYSNFVDSSGCASSSRKNSAFHPELVIDCLLGSGAGGSGSTKTITTT